MPYGFQNFTSPLGGSGVTLAYFWGTNVIVFYSTVGLLVRTASTYLIDPEFPPTDLPKSLVMLYSDACDRYKNEWMNISVCISDVKGA